MERDMLLFTKEHYEMMEHFEKDAPGRTNREPKENWSRHMFYENGEVNNAFLAFQRGVAYGRSVFLEPA
jgi:hypothetical protein